jgi:hypothetical protein
MSALRFRAKDRDASSDAGRIGRIRQAYHSAIESAEAELAGLRRRMEANRVDASFLLEDGGERREAGGEWEKAVGRTERRILRGEQRVKELTAHIDQLRNLLDGFESVAG